jgi:transcriptional regulator GlxA family with amidase domain
MAKNFVTGTFVLLLRLLILGVSIFLIWYSIRRFFKPNDSDRFLTTTRLSIMDREVKRACDYIEKHFAEPSLTAAQVAESIITGEAFLEALFARELGMSVGTFIEQVRVNRVRALYAHDTLMSSADIAVACGLETTVHLDESFKRVIGSTFEDFRSTFKE